jgi:hypothetical protein
VLYTVMDTHSYNIDLDSQVQTGEYCVSQSQVRETRLSGSVGELLAVILFLRREAYHD